MKMQAMINQSWLRTLNVIGVFYIRRYAGVLCSKRCAGVLTNYSTRCFLLHLQLSKNYIKELSWTQYPNTAYLNNGQTDRQQ